MRLALIATLLVLSSTSASAQAPVYIASAGLPVRLASAPPARAATPLFARVEAGITAAWPAGEADFSDYDAQEIEAGTADGDLYVRWTPFDTGARQFAVEVARAGGPFETVAVVAATAAGEYGVRLVAVVPGLYQVRMRETGAAGTAAVSEPLHIRI